MTRIKVMFAFGRKRISRDPIDDSWRPGDLAVCIRDDWTIPAAFHPRAGDLLRVKRIYTDAIDGARVTALTFEALAPAAGYPSSAFRKPVGDDRSADLRFIERLRKRSNAAAAVASGTVAKVEAA